MILAGKSPTPLNMILCSRGTGVKDNTVLAKDENISFKVIILISDAHVFQSIYQVAILPTLN